jgi:hypothetical protein
MKISKNKMLKQIDARLGQLESELQAAAAEELKFEDAERARIRERIDFGLKVLHSLKGISGIDVSIDESERWSSSRNHRVFTITINPFSGKVPQNLTHFTPRATRRVEVIEEDIKRAQRDMALIRLAEGDTLNLQVKEMDRMQDYLN